LYIDTWHRTSCPKCETINWVNGGSLEDFSAVDVECIECYACHMKYWISEPMKEEPDEEFCDLGIANPNEGK